MTLRRATLYVGGASLLVAWFSSAASLSLARNPQRGAPAGADATPPTEGVAANVQSQARRLRERMSAAPLPQRPLRNPFLFRAAPSAAPLPVPLRSVGTMSPPLLAEPVPAEPMLVLVGMAEQRTSGGLVRTAVLTSDGVDVIMAAVGTTVLSRYTVTAIGAEAVELSDTSTGRTRRLVLQDQ